LVVTKWGFIAYGSGKNSTTTEFSNGRLVERTIKRVNLTTDYFIKF